MTVITLLAVVACGDTVSTTKTPASGNTTDIASSGNFGADLNAFRAAQGRGAVTTNRLLQRAAQAHAEDMVRNDYFAHRSPSGAGMSDRIAASGYRACAAAENIAQGQKSEAEVFAAWRGSDGHRRNMLGPRYQNYGLGQSGDTWVLLLASGC